MYGADTWPAVCTGARSGDGGGGGGGWEVQSVPVSRQGCPSPDEFLKPVPQPG